MLKIGLLWYDADPKRTLQFKMDDAAERYLQKFGVPPNTCHVNPEDKTNHPRLVVVGNKSIRRNHFWLGVDDELEAEASPAGGDQKAKPAVTPKTTPPRASRTAGAATAAKAPRPEKVVAKAQTAASRSGIRSVNSRRRPSR